MLPLSWPNIPPLQPSGLKGLNTHLPVYKLRLCSSSTVNLIIVWNVVPLGYDYPSIRNKVFEFLQAFVNCRSFSLLSVQFSRSVISDSLWPHELQHARPPCPSPTLRVYSNSCPSSRWCHPAISSSVVPFSSRLQSFPASASWRRLLLTPP